MDTLYKKHLIKKSTWESFLKAEKMIEAEMQDTKTEAEELGMGGNIFQAAHQQFLQLVCGCVVLVYMVKEGLCANITEIANVFLRNFALQPSKP
jgi:hypothetical protein